MKKLKIIIGMLILIMLIGCKKDVYGCDIKGHTVTDIELCKAIQESEWENYEQGKLVGESCDDEIYNRAYKNAKSLCDDTQEELIRNINMIYVTDEQLNNKYITEYPEGFIYDNSDFYDESNGKYCKVAIWDFYANLFNRGNYYARC